MIGQFNHTFYDTFPFPLAITTCYFVIVKYFHNLYFYTVSLDIAEMLVPISNKAYVF